MTSPTRFLCVFIFSRIKKDKDDCLLFILGFAVYYNGESESYHEQMAQDRLWNKRPDGIAIKMPTKTRAGVVCLLEFKHMSDVTNHYIVRSKRVAESQYASLRSALTMTIQRQGR